MNREINDKVQRDLMEAAQIRAKAEWNERLETERMERAWNLKELAAFAVTALLVALLAWCVLSDRPHERAAANPATNSH